jgi:Glycosyltransferase family 87
MTAPGTAVRLARTVALAVIIGIGLFNLYQAATNWTLSDAGAYWLAATRLREGEPLYPALASVDASEVYRYAPWFAWLAVPFTLLPQWLAGTLWSVILLAASALALAPLVRMQAWIPVALFAPILVGISAVGNVQPLIIAPLMWTLERRSGPIFMALAASLKVFPLLLALVYAGRRQWDRLVVAVLLTALLWVPAPLFYDLRTYPTDPGQAGFLVTLPVLYVVAIGLGIGATLALAATRFGWLAGGTTVALSLPRFFVYDVTYVMLGAQNQLKGES